MLDIATIRKAYIQRMIANILLIDCTYSIAEAVTKITNCPLLHFVFRKET